MKCTLQGPWWKVVACGLLTAVQPRLGAQESHSTITPFELGYSVRHMTADDGLHDNDVQSFVQTPDGYLWIGTYGGGLGRFNGFEISDVEITIPEETRFPNVTDMLLDASGRIWVVGGNGVQIAIRSEEVRTFGPADGAPGGIWSITENRDGSIWGAIGVNGKVTVVKLAGASFETVAERNASAYPNGLAFDLEGNLWGTVAHGGIGGLSCLFRLHDGRIVPYELSSEPRELAFFRREGNDRLHAAGTRGIYVLHKGEWEEHLRFSSPIPGEPRVFSATEDPDGNYWVATYLRGLWVVRPDGQTFKVQPEAFDLPDKCRSVFVDRNGSVWVGGRTGLYQFFHQPFTLCPGSEKVRHRAVQSMAEDGSGTMWFAGLHHVCFLEAGRKLVEVPESWPDMPKTVVAGKRNGPGAWVSSWGGPIFFQTRERRDKGFLPGVKTETVRGRAFICDMVDTGDRLWIGHEGRLLAYKDDKTVPMPLPGPGPAADDLLQALARDSAGRLYAGFDRSGVHVYENEQWRWLGLEGMVKRIVIDPENRLWVRMDSGKLGWQSDEGWMVTAERLSVIPPDFSFVAARDGGLWFRGRTEGVVRLDRAAVQAHLLGQKVEIPHRHFGLTDGLPSMHADQYARSIFEDRKGRIWVATDRGACAYDPIFWRDDGSGEASMPLAIERIRIDDEDVAWSATGVTLEPHARRLEINYVGLDLANPEKVTYRYRLEGLDVDWIEAGHRRTAYYQDLPPGEFTFHVAGADRHGRLSSAAASVSIVVQPQWWQRGTVRLGGAALAGFLLWMMHVRRVRGIRRRAKMHEDFSRRLIESQEEERKRLAGELHDSLNQDLLLMKNRLYLIEEKLPDGSEPHKELQAVGEVNAQVIQAVREMSRDLRPYQLDGLGLTKAIRGMVENIRESTRMPVDLEIDNMDKLFSQEYEINIFRVIQESLNNVIKHSNASRVRVTAFWSARVLKIQIEDDGCGFEFQRQMESKTGFGLNSLQERVWIMEGSFDCKTAPGAGTVLTFRIPISESSGHVDEEKDQPRSRR